MKKLLSLLALAALFARGPLHAAEPVPANPSSGLPAAKEMAALEHFLDLTDEDLDQMQRVIARIRAMNPAERTALRAEIARFRSLPEPQRRQLRQGWGALDERLQEAWRQMMQSVSRERRAEIQTRLQALPPEKKAAYRQELAEEFLRQSAKK